MDQITALTPRGQTGRRWADTFSRTNPKEYAEVCEVVKDFVNGGRVKLVFPSLHALHRYLSGRDPENKIKPIINVSVDAFVRFSKRIEMEDQG
jgi:hypothetical protein